MAEKSGLDGGFEDGAPLKPNKVFSLNSSSGDFSDEVRVLDVSHSIPLGGFTGTVTEDFGKQVEQAGKETKEDRSAWAFELDRGTFSSTMKFHDAADGGAVVAELDMSILKHYGSWTMHFPEQSAHSSHDIEVRPLGVWKKQETFVKDSVPYLWDMSEGKGGRLYGVVGEKRVPVAAYAAKQWFQNSCVLVMNTELLDEVVILASCVAVLNRHK